MSKYRKACEKINAVPIIEKLVSKVLFRLFPNIKMARQYRRHERKCVYVGISFKKRRDNSELHPMTIQESLLYPCVVTTQTLSCVTLMVMSSVVTNGNIVMKIINLNFTNQTWTLTVRGKDVCLSDYRISDKFSKTKSNLNEILLITSRLDICTGLELVNKKKISVNFRLEEVEIRGDKNTHEMRMRSRACKQVLSWYCTKGNSCRTCAKYLYTFNNKSEDNVINLSKVDGFGYTQSSVTEDPQRASESVSDSGSTQSSSTEDPQRESESVSDYGSAHSSATEDEQKRGLKKTVKRKISKGKGNDKKKAKKSVACKFPCGVCSMECSDNVVCCDGCDTWFHADCIHVENLDELPDNWFCNICKDEKENMSS